MCGIAGFIGSDPRLDEAMLRRMHEAQKHRGPDDAGVLFQNLESAGDAPPLRVGLAHNRLSIQDLSSAGHQPMSDAEQACWICYNGEFYNSPVHRSAMKRSGVSFRSTSDTEVLLYLCRDRGVEKALGEVNGMFAFAFYDATLRHMHLCRDRAGQKPLFYLHLTDGSLVFASEIPALLATGLVNVQELDPVALDQYWTLGYTAGEHTFFKDIRRLRPGSMLTWRDRRAEITSYWSVTFDPVDEGRSMGEYVDELIPLLEDSVRLRLLADVPVGICLSGGIDSALMALMISRLRADVPAYTIAFEGTPEDESRHATAIAKHLGIEHRVLNVSGDMASDFPAIAAWYGEPFGDASSIPMYFLSKMIREHATVALTGDGGDELFGGYHHYREGMRVWGEGLQVAGCRLQVGGGKEIEPRMTRMVGGMDWGRKFRVSSFKFQVSGFRDLALGWLGIERGYPLVQRHVNRKLKRKLYGKELWTELNRVGEADVRRHWLAASRDPLAAMQNCDFHVYMTDDVHTKVDRMSMAHALECRSPFMDYRIIEWAARLPARIKLAPDGRGKLVLRELLGNFMPRELYERPKQGFTPPWEKWCEGALRENLRKDWMELDDPLMRKEAIDCLVPGEGSVSPVLSWMAYSFVEWEKNLNHG
ncbi:MAG TPA: asparagine synthase (glutamine-hydrolyzing) [Kiritimatiellia bacterium]|nr:asparagine synthase (glutamine-hydrolyzing) [Kiritimatiellia bacterium]